MRKRLATGCLVLVASLPLVGFMQPAWAADKTEVSKCVEEAVHTGQQADICVKASNPILPASNELIYGIIAFAILLVLMSKLALPALRKGMEGRTERIRGNLDDAERIKTEAQTILDQYQAQLADARTESNRIIEEARQTADALRRDLMQRAEAEVNDLKQRTTDDINAARDRTLGDLRQSVAQLSIELAEKVVEKNLDRETNLALIESYINQDGAART